MSHGNLNIFSPQELQKYNNQLQREPLPCKYKISILGEFEIRQTRLPRKTNFRTTNYLFIYHYNQNLETQLVQFLLLVQPESKKRRNTKFMSSVSPVTCYCMGLTQLVISANNITILFKRFKRKELRFTLKNRHSFARSDRH